MTEKFKVLDWTIEVNKNQTQALHAELSTPSDLCNCLYCQNFEKALPSLPEKFIEILSNLGADASKATEVYELYEVEKGIHLYGGWYHVIGQIIEGQDSHLEFEGKSKEANLRPLEDNFNIGFTMKTDLAPKDFPEPILQIEFTGNLPWLLEKTP